ncbi:MAG TPA: hypothetical protein VG500_19455 [Gemmatimonadales bacterium]|nr:hypothetical protein [Gemmatimonadales bacterium]
MRRCLQPLLPAFLLTAGCGDGSGPGQAILDCDEVAPTALAPGQTALVDASEAACVRLGASDAEYLYVAYSAAAAESRDGTSAEYRLAGSDGVPPAALVRPRPMPALSRPDPAREFHLRLRALGQDLARERSRRARGGGAPPAAKAPPPAIGEERTFNVLRSAEVSGQQAGDYVQVTGTARYVGTHAAIFLDNAAPTDGGYTQADLDAIGALFDDHLHPIAVNAFGAESDVNGDGLVLVLLSDHVTRLAGCSEDRVVVGLFFAVDLIAGHVGSNNAEIFYALTPDPSCGVDREDAIARLPAVFVHEFQHMINYGQKVVQREGDAEDTWLEEGLSGFAEELGGRLVPGDQCLNDDCLTQFHRDNLANAYRYLGRMDSSYLIGPRRPPLPLTQYGATWLFLRWLADHFAADPVLGTDLTRALVQTTRTGADNVAAATAQPFDRLIGEWQFANYLEDLPDSGFPLEGSRFQYNSWSLREVFASFNQQDPADFPAPYPLEPDVYAGGDYAREGVLRAGSGRHLVVEQSAGSPLDLRLTDPSGQSGLPAAAAPRTLILRLR